MAFKRLTLPILGLTCSSEGLMVERVVAKLPGVISAYVNPATDKAYVEFDPRLCSVAQIGAAIELLGFQVGRTNAA